MQASIFVDRIRKKRFSISVCMCVSFFTPELTLLTGPNKMLLKLAGNYFNKKIRLNLTTFNILREVHYWLNILTLP